MQLLYLFGPRMFDFDRYLTVGAIASLLKMSHFQPDEGSFRALKDSIVVITGKTDPCKF